MISTNLQSKRASAEPANTSDAKAIKEVVPMKDAANPEQPAAEAKPEKSDDVIELTEEAARMSIEEKAKEIVPAEESKEAPATAQTDSKVDNADMSRKRSIEEITPAAEKDPKDIEEKKPEDAAATKVAIGSEKRLRVEEDATAEKKPEAIEPRQINTTPEVPAASKEKTEVNAAAETKDTKVAADAKSIKDSKQDDTVSEPETKEKPMPAGQIEVHESPSMVKDIPLTEAQVNVFQKSDEKNLSPVEEQPSPKLGEAGSNAEITEQPKQPTEAEKATDEKQVDVEQAYLEAATAGDTGNSANVQQ
jgi:hypothetical protein